MKKGIKDSSKLPTKSKGGETHCTPPLKPVKQVVSEKIKTFTDDEAVKGKKVDFKTPKYLSNGEHLK